MPAIIRGVLKDYIPEIVLKEWEEKYGLHIKDSL